MRSKYYAIIMIYITKSRIKNLLFKHVHGVHVEYSKIIQYIIIRRVYNEIKIVYKVFDIK